MLRWVYCKIEAANSLIKHDYVCMPQDRSKVELENEEIWVNAKDK